MFLALGRGCGEYIPSAKPTYSPFQRTPELPILRGPDTKCWQALRSQEPQDEPCPAPSPHRALSRVQSLICLCNPKPSTGLAPAGHWGSVSHAQVWLPGSNGANVKGDEGCNLCLRPGQNGPE